MNDDPRRGIVTNPKPTSPPPTRVRDCKLTYLAAGPEKTQELMATCMCADCVSRRELLSKVSWGVHPNELQATIEKQAKTITELGSATHQDTEYMNEQDDIIRRLRGEIGILEKVTNAIAHELYGDPSEMMRLARTAIKEITDIRSAR